MKFDNVLTGFLPLPQGRDGLALAVLLARQAGARLTVATVQPPAWGAPGPARADASAWAAYLEEQAVDTLAQAHELAGEDADFITHTHKGSGRGLVELARKRGSDAVVIGSAPGARVGRIAVGSTADQLLHASPVPVVLAPRGYADNPPATLDRLTVAYRRGPCADAAVKRAAELAGRMDLPLRLVTLLLSSARPVKVELDMLARLRDQAAADLNAAARGHRRRTGVEVELLEGRSVAAALASGQWLAGDFIICASSDSGPLRRVFLGDTSIKIVRAATCPVMILTRTP
ncbi:universal stress protein [Nonomuraea glycinis]|uniref:Universal stress protein n=1 Tax=Nonomuraea glycinis TaxID=2047744 RepID=A0A918E6R7_9ACTN|nr:universal stress protein [Nonomuraea glycinis]MCA2178694.1 universal stress protein [Nonomuraea glycinis]GGP07890.1 universal stress protein [Nonomuraea glycinis]